VISPVNNNLKYEYNECLLIFNMYFLFDFLVSPKIISLESSISSIHPHLQEDQDAMEADLDKAEIIKPQNGEMSGDRLLNSCYVNTTTSASRRRRVSR
jgi:hypothetical protein